MSSLKTTVVSHLCKSFLKMQRIAKSGGKSVREQMSDILHLRELGAGVGIDDYFILRLFEPEVKREDLRTYLGTRKRTELAAVFNDAQYTAFTQDKLIFDGWARAYGVKLPNLKAILGGEPIPTDNIPLRVTSLSEFRCFLADNPETKLFIKPVLGSYGISNYILSEFDPAKDKVRVNRSEYLELAELWERLWKKLDHMDPRRGYLVQECVQQHQELVATAGPSLSTVRLISLVAEEAVHILAGEWKVSTGNRPNDNFNSGRSGNLLVGIDIDTGKTTWVSEKLGGPLHSSYKHPDTGAELTGRSFPDWEAAKELVKTASRAIPMLHLQHWDVGFSDEGPVLIELNSVGGPDAIQYINKQGIITDRLREAAMEDFKRYGYKRSAPRWIRA